jgi:hypothetical protein
VGEALIDFLNPLTLPNPTPHRLRQELAQRRGTFRVMCPSRRWRVAGP